MGHRSYNRYGCQSGSFSLTDMYSEKVLDHFQNPRNIGELGAPAVTVETTNPVCGDSIKLSVLARDGKITDAKFKVQGCVPAVACGSWLTETMQGKSLSELASVSAERVEQGLGGLPQASRHASALAADALRQALEKLG